MTTAIESLPPLYPRTVTPPPKPLPLARFVMQFLKNPLLVLPQGAYEEWIVSFESSRARIFWITAPELVEEILVKRTADFEKTPVEKRVFRHTLKDGVLTSNGPLWRWQRRTMAPLFRAAEILNYIPGMAQPAEDQLAKWRASPPGSVQQIGADMVETTFSVISRTMLQGGEPREADIIKRATALSLKYVTWEIMYGFLKLPIWLPHPASWLLARTSRQLRGAVHDIIARRLAEDDGGEDLLGRLLAARDPESGEPMSMDQLINNLLTLLEAGHETTSRALTWTLYLLARSPEWQEKVRAEIAEVCGEGPIAPEHVARLTLTGQVLKEAMRLYAPVPVMSRLVLNTIELGGVTVPAGSITVIPIFCIHRHKKLWHDPQRFDPTRFEPAREAAYPRTQFMPFGGGQRICLGSIFAMTEATVLLATLIRGARFDWDGKHDPEPVSRVTLQPRGGMPLRVTPLAQPPVRYL
ncbi:MULTISPECIES: cytochrome P450 [Rhodomicrobium]|uniref:cytochrome P450 n=1 Tax=Rhodomicrobium TaxID=1068 RepID=UPI000B4BC2F4|nr:MULTISPECIES: cytochrome P450 [Rhodomicrobium]